MHERPGERIRIESWVASAKVIVRQTPLQDNDLLPVYPCRVQPVADDFKVVTRPCVQGILTVLPPNSAKENQTRCNLTALAQDCHQTFRLCR